MLKIFDAEVIIYREGFTQLSGVGQVEIQYLYYAQMKITIDSIELKKGKTLGRNEVGREKKTGEKEQKGNKEKQTGV